MGYGVNTQWGSLRGRARRAGSSKGKSTRTASSRRAGSARRARKKKTVSTRRSLPLDPRGKKIGKAPRDWGGSQIDWILYVQNKGPGKWA
jgi:hypothetical protein